MKCELYLGDELYGNIREDFGRGNAIYKRCNTNAILTISLSIKEETKRIRIRILAYLDTHYYGGVKKYQWVTLPWQFMA